jgi:hypothetical protein
MRLRVPQGRGGRVSATSPERAFGHCRHCGTETEGVLVQHIDRASGPGWTVVVCPPCEKNPPAVPHAERPRTYSL